MNDHSEKKVIPPRKGLMHFVDAAGYSLGGARRLWQETAAQQEIAGGALAALLLWVAGAQAWEWGVAAVLWLLLIAVEALNTAIEVLVDRVSPEWSVAARDAKNLGSLAVACMIAALSGFVGVVVVF